MCAEHSRSAPTPRAPCPQTAALLRSRHMQHTCISGGPSMTNPYLSLEPRELAGVWGMRAAELLPADEDSDATEGANRDTALMLLAGAMNVADREIQVSYGHCILDADRRLHQRRIRFEVLKRA